MRASYSQGTSQRAKTKSKALLLYHTKTFTLKATTGSNTDFTFVSDNPADDLAEGTHNIALNPSEIKGVYVTAGIDASLLKPGSQIVVMFCVYFPSDYTMAFDVSGNKLYGYRCNVNSVQMADEIHAQIYSGDIESTKETYTAKTYPDKVIASSNSKSD